MTVIIVKIPINDEYGFLIEYENEEVWISEEGVGINDVQRRWNQCKSKTKLHDFMIASNFRLVGFEEIIK